MKFNGGFSSFLHDQMMSKDYEETVDKAYMDDQQNNKQYDNVIGMIYDQSLFEQIEIEPKDLEDNIDELL